MSEQKHRSTIKRGTGPDAVNARKKIGDFDPENAESTKELNRLFSTKKCKTKIILEVAKAICENNERFKLDRDQKRRRRNLLKWFSDNWDEIKEYVRNSSVLDKNFNVIKYNEPPPK